MAGTIFRDFREGYIDSGDHFESKGQGYDFKSEIQQSVAQANLPKSPLAQMMSGSFQSAYSPVFNQLANSQALGNAFAYGAPTNRSQVNLPTSLFQPGTYTPPTETPPGGTAGTTGGTPGSGGSAGGKTPIARQDYNPNLYEDIYAGGYNPSFNTDGTQFNAAAAPRQYTAQEQGDAYAEWSNLQNTLSSGGQLPLAQLQRMQELQGIINPVHQSASGTQYTGGAQSYDPNNLMKYMSPESGQYFSQLNAKLQSGQQLSGAEQQDFNKLRQFGSLNGGQLIGGNMSGVYSNSPGDLPPAGSPGAFALGAHTNTYGPSNGWNAETLAQVMANANAPVDWPGNNTSTSGGTNATTGGVSRPGFDPNGRPTTSPNGNPATANPITNGFGTGIMGDFGLLGATPSLMGMPSGQLDASAMSLLRSGVQAPHANGANPNNSLLNYGYNLPVNGANVGGLSLESMISNIMNQGRPNNLDPANIQYANPNGVGAQGMDFGSSIARLLNQNNQTVGGANLQNINPGQVNPGNGLDLGSSISRLLNQNNPSLSAANTQTASLNQIPQLSGLNLGNSISNLLGTNASLNLDNPNLQAAAPQNVTANNAQIQTGMPNGADSEYYKSVSDLLNNKFKNDIADVRARFTNTGTSRGTPAAWAETLTRQQELPELAAALGNIRQGEVANSLNAQNNGNNALLTARGQDINNSQQNVGNMLQAAGINNNANLTARQQNLDLLGLNANNTNSRLDNLLSTYLGQRGQDANLFSSNASNNVAAVQANNSAALGSRAQDLDLINSVLNNNSNNLGNLLNTYVNQRGQNINAQATNASNNIAAGQANNQASLANRGQDIDLLNAMMGNNNNQLSTLINGFLGQRGQDIGAQSTNASNNIAASSANNQAMLGARGQNLDLLKLGADSNSGALSALLNAYTTQRGQDINNSQSTTQAHLQKLATLAEISQNAGNLNLGYDTLNSGNILQSQGMQTDRARALLDAINTNTGVVGNNTNNLNSLLSSLSQFNAAQGNNMTQGMATLQTNANEAQLNRQFQGLQSLAQIMAQFGLSGIPGGSANVSLSNSPVQYGASPFQQVGGFLGAINPYGGK